MFEQMPSSQMLAAPQGQSTFLQSDIQPAELQKSLLFAAMENFSDGLVIVAKTGEILHRNQCAQQLLKLVEQPYQTLKRLPKRIWQTCQTLLHNEDPFSGAVRVVLEDEIEVVSQNRIRVRVQWFSAEAQDCFLILLEDCLRSAERSATNEAHRYGLTPREAEVWQLKRADLTYKEIAQQLYISENTVKKHLKSVYAKREQADLLAG
ncbi:MAG: LuxR C-terminal-related transcriptional regulator [Cyanobacteria bacterium J06648_16]